MKTLKRSCVLAVAFSALLCAGCDGDGEKAAKAFYNLYEKCEGTKTTTLTVGSFSSTLAISCTEPGT